MNPVINPLELDKKIGQLFIGGMPGPELDYNTIKLIKNYNLGGIILFKRNIIDPVQLACLCRDIQNLSMEYIGTPLFLAIDQEGGRVARLTKPFTQFHGNSAIGRDQRPEDRAVDFAGTPAVEMALVGLNMDMAPVLDVARPKIDPHLEGRCFSENPHMVTMLGKIVINELQQGGIMAVAKHFPGLGKAGLDPHLQLPIIAANQDEMESVHLPPFAGAIKANVSAIMSSHAVYPALDPENPGTLSKKIMTGLMREKMGFQGLAISDDLEMGAIVNETGVAQGALNAFIAGIDLLLICSDQAYLIESIELLKNRVFDGEIPTERLKNSFGRIERYKKRFLFPYKSVSLREVRDYFKDNRA
jgi:beta-N-acetylhexosaminidase